MRLIINLVLIALAGVLIWVLASSISEPIKFQDIRSQREGAVIDRLMEIREAQELYRNVAGKFANSFDSLKYVLNTGKLQTISVFGDPDDPSNTDAIRYDTSYSPAIDKVNEMGINLDSLAYVPYGNGAKFDIQADTLTYQSTLVDVVEVGVIRKKFMGQWGDIRFARYDSSYDPNTIIKFGNMNAPNTSGNWER
ncbi:MAG: hypothetical protein AAF985_17340 [Bacteroidota bacterium]